MISGYLVGDRQLVKRLGAMPQAIRDEVVPTVDRLLFALEGRVKSEYLRGPRPTHLGVVTGRLSSSIGRGGADSRTRMEVNGDHVYGYVGTNVSYGADWENGFRKRIGAGARGGPRTLTGKARDAYFARHPPGVKDVSARPFLSPALADLHDLIVRELQAALLRGMQKAMKS